MNRTYWELLSFYSWAHPILGRCHCTWSNTNIASWQLDEDTWFGSFLLHSHQVGNSEYSFSNLRRSIAGISNLQLVHTRQIYHIWILSILQFNLFHNWRDFFFIYGIFFHDLWSPCDMNIYILVSTERIDELSHNTSYFFSQYFTTISKKN